MNEVTIIKYSPNYDHQLQNLIVKAENFGEPFLDNEFKIINTFHNSPNYGTIILALNIQKDEIIGYAAIEYGWRSLIIKSLIVHHNYLRKKVGSGLINYIKDLGEKKPNITVVRVDTADFMIYAQRFYLANDFIITGHVSHDLSWNNTQIHFSVPLKGYTIE